MNLAAHTHFANAFLVGLTVFTNAALLQAATIEFDIPTSTIRGNFLINGSPAPANNHQFGNIYLRNPQTDDEIHLGATHEGSYSQSLMPGAYEVYYEHARGERLVPLNKHALIGELTVPARSGVRFIRNIDVPMTSLSGTFLINGEDPLANAYNHGRIFAVDASSQDEVELGRTHEQSFNNVKLIPGSYDVFYGHTIGSQVPGNGRAFLTSIEVAPLPQLNFVRPISVPEPSTGIMTSLAALLTALGTRARVWA